MTDQVLISPVPSDVDARSLPLVRWLADLRRTDVASVGGKNASLGELLQELSHCGVRVPDGFATTAQAYRAFLDAADITSPLKAAIAAFRAGQASLSVTGDHIRALFLAARLPESLTDAITHAYRELCRRIGSSDIAVAVRSSATAEDLPDASFAGQQESFLGIRGEVALIEACRRCYASLFTDRAIAYREAKGFDHLQIALSIGVQPMIRSDIGASGILFSIEPESGFPGVAVISAGWGLGEPIVQGSVDPDTYVVFKGFADDARIQPVLDRQRGGKACKMAFADDGGITMLPTTQAQRDGLVLSDQEVLLLTRWAIRIEEHYGQPMDIEWAKDGITGEIFVVQARPETIHHRDNAVTRTFRLEADATPILTGAAVGEAIASGMVHHLSDASLAENFPEGGILVAATTDPDWMPAMRRASGIVTDHGGTTSHAAIVSRELGVPAVVGTERGTALLQDGQTITLSCAEGDVGKIYAGALPFTSEVVKLDDLPVTHTQLMINAADPAAAFRWWRLPTRGVGLTRIEFMIANLIGIHPMAIAHPERITDAAVRDRISELCRHHADAREYFIDTLARGVARIAAAHHPHPVIVRLSDFKSNEYAHLLGGSTFEAHEENPMLGFRGASRYYHERYRDGFALECLALCRAREEMGFDNIVVMVPFCRTPAEADKVLAEMAHHGLQRGEQGLQVYMMCEIPSNLILAEEFARRFDGFSIGSNDLTQLVLGVDRDSTLLAPLFDERDPAVTKAIADFIARAHACGAKVGICGQAPSDHPEFAVFLVEQGIDSISLNADSFVATLRQVAEAEAGKPR